MKAIESEVKMFIDSGFIREEQHPNWVAISFPFPRRMKRSKFASINHDLNVVYPKDKFSLPSTNVMIERDFESMSFLDGFSEYNQIKMYPEDEKHTSFKMFVGVYCYIVMPFSLKNTGATYQCAMNAIFHEYIHKTVECYVDDIAMKSRDNKANTSQT